MGEIFKRYTFLFALFCILFSASAKADVTTFNVQFFKPNIGPSSYMMLRDSQSLNPFQFQFGNTFSYAYHPLDLRQGNTRLRGVVDQLLMYHLTSAIGFTKWFEFGMEVPVAILNRFEGPSAASNLSNKFSFGDLRFEAKFKPLDKCKNPLGLAFVPFITAPTGKDSYYLGDSGITGGLITALDLQMNTFAKWTLNLGFEGGKKVNIRNVDYQYNLIYGTGFAFEVRDFDLFAELNGLSAFNHFFSKKTTTPIEMMGGMKWKAGNSGVRLYASLGTCLICGVKGARIRGTLGVSYRFNNKKNQTLDRAEQIMCVNKFSNFYDLEELYALKLKCPPNPKDFKAGVHDDACPKYYELQEIANLVNICPTNPEDFNPKFHDAACQKVYTLKDEFTNEQIWAIYELSAAEMSLRCPADPENFNPYLHDAACPKYYTLQETVELAKNCPSDPKDYKKGLHDSSCNKLYELRNNYTDTEWGFITMLAKRDTDGDGINDYLDRCPNYPEDKNGFADKDGCPEGGIVAITGGEIHTYKPVTFAFNSSTLDYDSKQMLDQIIGLINRTPWINLVRIGGHADGIGTWAANEKISMKRAMAVITYMRTHGLRQNVILKPIAYGDTRPVASNETEEGRARNRRVVFTAVEQAYGMPATTVRPTRKISEKPAANMTRPPASSKKRSPQQKKKTEKKSDDDALRFD